jgi:hypothetical protein
VRVPFVSCALSWWYLIGGMDYMVYLIGGISLVGTIRGRGGGGGGGLGARAFNSVMYAVVNMFIPARRLNKNVRRAHILEHIYRHIYIYISTTCRHVYMPCRSTDVDFDSIVCSNEERKKSQCGLVQQTTLTEALLTPG